MHVFGHAERAIQTSMLETSMTTSERSQTLDAHWIQFAQLQHDCVRGPWSPRRDCKRLRIRRSADTKTRVSDMAWRTMCSCVVDKKLHV